MIEDIYRLFPKITEAMDLLQRSFIYGKTNFLDQVQALTREVHESEKSLTFRLAEVSRQEGPLARYISIPGHLERIGDYMDNIARAVRVKNAEGVLFSDKAVDEINFLFEKVMDIITNTSDMLLARNTLIAGYVREAELAIIMSANDFATLHEERLIEGLCMPKGSSIYLDLLDAFKAIAWHCKEIVQKLIE